MADFRKVVRHKRTKSVIETRLYYQILAKFEYAKRSGSNNAHATDIYYPERENYIPRKREWLLLIHLRGQCEKPDSVDEQDTVLTLFAYNNLNVPTEDEEHGATMVRVKVKLCLCFIALMLLQSCSTPHWICTYNGEKFKTKAIYRPFVGMCEYKGGYWGEWFSDNRLRYTVDESITGFTIIYYNKYRHPSDFEFKIIAKKYTGTDKTWQVYQGEFIVKKTRETNISKHYTKPQSGISALKETWAFPCTIKRLESTFLPEDKYIYPQLPSPLKYTLNVFYNGVGRGFGIRGEWVQAGGYDTW